MDHGVVVKLVRPFLRELVKQAWPPSAKRSADMKLETATRLFNEWVPHMTQTLESELRSELTDATTHQAQLCTLQRKHGRAVIFVGSFWSTTRQYRRLARVAHDDAVSASNDARVKSANPNPSNGNRPHSPRLSGNTRPPSVRAQCNTNRIVIENHSTSSGTVFNNVYELPESNDHQSLSILVLNTGQTSQGIICHIFGLVCSSPQYPVWQSTQSSPVPRAGMSRSQVKVLVERRRRRLDQVSLTSRPLKRLPT